MRIPVFMIVGLLLLSAQSVHAGMPAPAIWSLSDLGEFRIQVISFFLAVILICALAIQALWNMLAKTLTNMPKLSYKSALALVFLLGLLFNIVLAMISGARELMTPGAWERSGIIFQLKETQNAPYKEEKS